MDGRTGGGREATRRAVRELRYCRALCEAMHGRLAAGGGGPEAAEGLRRVRECAEACELHARALERGSRGVRHTAALCVERCGRLAREEWPGHALEGQLLSVAALRAVRACRPLRGSPHPTPGPASLQ